MEYLGSISMFAPPGMGTLSVRCRFGLFVLALRPARTGGADATSSAAVSPGSKPDDAAAGEADDKPRWRLFHNRSFKLVPSYPLHFVVPAVMSDADVRCARSIAAGSLASSGRNRFRFPGVAVRMLVC